MRGNGQFLGAVVAVMAAGPALAHPHVYIDTKIRVVFDDQGRAAALEVAWTYDDFYSLLTVEERGLDGDHDGVADDADRAALSGFDLNWDAGFAGDTYALLGDAALVLGPPENLGADYQGGRIISTHRRAIVPPVVVGDALVVQAYDPGYYTDYSIVGQVELQAAPTGCTAQVFEPDPSVANAELQAALAEYGADETVEMEYPAIGASFADEVRVTCKAE